MIDENKTDHAVKKLCEVLDFPRSSYYELSSRVPSKTKIRRQNLTIAVKAIHEENNKIYGAPKIHKELVDKGNRCSLKLVQRIMNEEGLRSITQKKYKPHSGKNKAINSPAPNILNRDFSTTSTSEKLVSDITYIHTTKDGWCYLATIMDLYSRRIIGWSFSKTMTVNLTINALEKARRNIQIKNRCILHSDLGSQYTSSKYIEKARKLGFTLSYSRKGNPYDNACIESFHAILKKEWVYQNKYHSFEEAHLSIFTFIESWYNRKRKHSKLGYLSPIDYEYLAA